MKLKFFRIYLLPLYLLSALIMPVYADGQLDTLTFGGGGIVITDVPTYTGARANGVYIQADSNIVVVGDNERNPFAPLDFSSFVVARYDDDGTLDGTFGTAGIATIDLSSLSSGDVNVQAKGVAVQSDGKIVVVGTIYSDPPDDEGNVFVARLEADGLLLDTTFNAAGTLAGVNVLPDFQLSSNDQGNAIVVDLDGNIVVVGTSSLSSGSSAMAIARLTDNGILDTSFNVTGQQIVQFAIGSLDQGFAVALEADGRTIIAAGSSDGSSGAAADQPNFAFARLSSTGVIGITPIALFSNDPDELENIITEAHAVLVQPDGKIVLIGSTTEWPDGNGYFAFARYNSDGTLDAAFSSVFPSISLNPGTFVTPSVGNPLTETSQAFAGALQSDGKIIAAGFGPSSLQIQGDNFMLARLIGSNGALDATFIGGGAPPGFVFTSIQEDGLDRIYAVALQGDGNIVAAGSTATGATVGLSQDIALARYVATPPLTPTLILTPLPNESVSGIVTFSGTAQNPAIIDILIDDVLLGSTVTIGATNAWTFTNTDPIDPGEHSVRVVARYRDDGHVNLEATLDIVCTIEASDLLLITCASTALEDTLANSVTGGTPPYSFSQVGAAVNGTLLLGESGPFTFTPTAGFVGDGSFQYQVSDSGVSGCISNTATVTVAIEQCCPPIDPTSFFGQLISPILS